MVNVGKYTIHGWYGNDIFLLNRNLVPVQPNGLPLFSWVKFKTWKPIGKFHELFWDLFQRGFFHTPRFEIPQNLTIPMGGRNYESLNI